MADASPAPLTETDANHVNLLGIFHYVLGGITLAGGFCPSLHLGMGIIMATGGFPADQSGQPPPPIIGVMIGVFAGGMMIAGWVLGALMLYAGGCLRAHRRYTFCQVVGGIECVFMPLGTILGVFTLVVLNRASIRAAFEAPSRPGEPLG